MKQKLAFRVDVSKKIGIGHLIRLINLEKKLDTTPTWLIKTDNFEINNFLSPKNKILIIKNNIDEIEAINYLIKNNIKKIIFDISHIENIRKNADSKLINIYKRNNFKTISYNVNLNRNLISEISIIPYNLKNDNFVDNKLLFLGPQYLGIKNSKKNKIKKIKKILICIGGADVFNLGSKIFKQLFNMSYQIIYISGQNKTRFNLENTKHKIFNHIKDIKKTIDKVDLVICGEGLIKYEAVYSNKPIFLVHQFGRGSILIKKFLENNVCASYKAKIINNHFKINLIKYINNKNLITRHLNNQYVKFMKKNNKTEFKKLIDEIERL